MGRSFLLSLQFDGTAFSGWQRQRAGRTVQEELERRLSRLAGAPTRAIAAGRTDAGVHALALPVSCTLPDRWNAAAVLRALNAILPRDIAVAEVHQTRSGIDARRTALARRYQYDIGTDPASRSPFRGRTEWALGRSPRLELLRAAALGIAGEHDFRAFAVVGEPKPHYRCTIGHAEWEYSGPGRLRFTVEADRFLHRMVRFLVGTMVEIALERRDPEELELLLRLDHNQRTAPPAPAAGLSFLRAGYPPDIYEMDHAAWPSQD